MPDAHQSRPAASTAGPKAAAKAPAATVRPADPRLALLLAELLALSVILPPATVGVEVPAETVAAPAPLA